jgi:hypothetical protein
MKAQHDINDPVSGNWCRCERIEFVGETANWELKTDGWYSYFEAYQKSPHRQLVDAVDDSGLRTFVKAWGPLRSSLTAWEGSDPIESYRSERDRLSAIVRLLSSVEVRQTQRSALIELSELSHKDKGIEIAVYSLGAIFRIAGSLHVGFNEEIRHWLEIATPDQIDSATISLLPMLGPPWGVEHTFFAQRTARGNILKADIGLDGLSDALHWMIWQDVFQSHPYRFCAECRKLIKQDTRHEKKFCSHECAHRKTAREWQQRKRVKDRRVNGIKKAR